jgi:hypothetical protein
MVIAVIVLVLTVSGAVAVTLPDFAVMVVDPNATAVANPAESMVATPVAEESQVTLEVTSLVELLPRVPVAVNCCVLPGLIWALAGDNVMETMEFEEGKNPPQPARTTALKNPAPSLPNHASRCTLIVLIGPELTAFKALGGLLGLRRGGFDRPVLPIVYYVRRLG